MPTVNLRAGKTVYTCRFTAHGIRHVDVSTGERDLERATAAAARLYAEALLRRCAPKRRRVRHADQGALDVLAADYLANVEASGLAASYLRKQKMHFHAHFLPRWDRVTDLTTAAIERYAVERAQEPTHRGAAPSTVTVYKEMVTLNRFLRWCVRAGHLDAAPVFDRVRPVSDHKAPDISRREVERVLAALPTRHTHPKHYAVRERYTVQWAQGMRDGEVATLRWADVDLAAGRVTIRQSNDKARQGRTVELAEDAALVLADLAREPHIGTALVFGRADLRGSLTAACKRAGVARMTTHVFRHARLSELASASHDTAAIQFAAGHKSLATTDRYVRSRTERTGKVFAAADSVKHERTRHDAASQRRRARAQPPRR